MAVSVVAPRSFAPEAAVHRTDQCSSSVCLVFAIALLTPSVLLAGAAHALDGREANARAAAPAFKDPMQALRKYVESYNKPGDSDGSLEALRYAAEGGQPLAQWKLGSLYAAGEGGLPRDDRKAYEYFSQIVDNYDEDEASQRDKSVVSSAFVAVGVYSLNGIPGMGLRRDPQRAMEMFHYAATTFSDPNAQYNLARMYLDGVGMAARDTRQAARWLNLAADKSHKEAQALLGNLLFKGADGVPVQHPLGLMYLTLSRDAASDSKKDAWIVDLYDQAMKVASDDEKSLARHFLESFVSRNLRAQR